MASNPEDVRKAAVRELAKRELARREIDHRESESAQPSASDVGLEFAGRRFIDNLLSVPSATGALAADVGNAMRAGAEHSASNFMRDLMGMAGGEIPKGPSLAERYREKTETEGFAGKLLRGIPRPTYEGITSAIKSTPALFPGGETPSDAMLRNRLEFQREELNMRDAHPVAAKAGEVAGDVLSIVGTRRLSGLDKLVRRVETRLGGKTSLEAAESLADDINKRLAGPAMHRLARGVGRSLESGVEAAALDILKDPNADPSETAALAAGGQLVGSGALQGAKGLLSGGPTSAGLKLSVAAVASMGLIQAFKSATPGGRDRILESAESGFDKVMLTLGIGIGSAALGATRYGRGNTTLSDQTRAVLDGLSTVHRGSTLSLLSDWTKGSANERSAIEDVLAKMASDPAYRGETDKEREIVSRIRTGAGLETYRTGGGF